MARTKRSSAATSRRSLAGLGTVGIVAGTITITAGLGAPAAHAAGKSLTYACTGSAFGAVLVGGDWSVNITTDAPTQVDPGAALPAPNITATVTTDAGTGDTSRTIGIKSMDGTSDAPYTVFGQDFTSKLTIPVTKVPASGPIVTTAKGAGQAATAPTTPGLYPVTVGDFTGTLNNYTTTDGSGASIGLALDCKLKAGQNATIAQIQVGAVASPTSTPTSPTSTPTSPTSTPTDTGTPTATATGTSTATSTATGTTSSTGVTGPPIITDGGSSDGGLNGGVLGGAAVAAAGVGALGFGLRRRLSNK